MRRTRMHQLGIVAGICLLGWCGMGRGAINSHLTWISIRQGQGFSSSDAVSPSGYFFVLKLRTDNTVSSVEFTTPMGLVCTIPAATHASTGDVQTSHKVGYGDVHAWEYQGWFNTIEGLSDYGDGTYSIKLNYTTGGPETTPVAYVVPGTSNPIPQPTYKPNITSPAFGASVVPPVALTWSACSDPNVDTTNGIAVEIYDSDDTDKLPKLYARTVTSTTADPCGIDDGWRSAQVMFQKRFTFNNANSIPCEILKGSATTHEFEVPYSRVYRFGRAGSPNCNFWTAFEDDKNSMAVIWPSIWQLEGSYFYACTGKHHPNLEEVYRFWNCQNDDHFYTASEAVRDYLIENLSSIYVYEGICFYAFLEGAHPPETVPLYRMWHSVDNMHYYTDDAVELNQMLTPPTSWIYEGIEFYVYP